MGVFGVPNDPKQKARSRRALNILSRRSIVVPQGTAPNQNSLAFSADDPIHTGSALINGTLNATVAGNNLTIALKTLAGNNPTTGDPVKMVTVDPHGVYSVVLAVTSTNIVIPAGATMGAVSSAPMRFWIVGFNVGGVIKLGAINCLKQTTSGAGGNILQVFKLRDNAQYESLALSAGSDSTWTIYSTVALTDATQLRILGYVEWTSSFPVSGLYADVPTDTRLFGFGVQKPGEIVQTENYVCTGFLSGATLVPLDDTIPQVSEGDQYMACSIDPQSSVNLILAKVQLNISNTAAVHVIVSLFGTFTNDAIKSWGETVNPLTSLRCCYFEKAMLVDQALPTSSYTVRAGGNAAGTTSVNGRSGARLFGGTLESRFELQEIMG